MAIGGTPVGNMIIKVDLDSAGVEKSMTGLQRQLKSSNKAMGAQLSAFGRSEKSAAKYGVMIEGLSNRHRIQARMVQEAQAKYALMSKEYGENSVKAQQASQELNEQISRYQETGRELDNMTAEFKEFQRVQEIQNKGWYKAADSMEQWGGKLQTAGTAMDQTGKTLTRKVSLPLAAVGGIATKVGSDFEAGISKVGAVSGASASEMEQLEAKAREMGATTVFSAKESSDAFYYMSLAGWDATEMMDGISGVMDLAAASGEDLAQVSDIVTDGLTAFGLSAKDSGRMADVLAAASANANTDVAGLGAAFSYAAPVAGALGYTMEDTSKAIGLMANAGIKSTKAGTALRTMMTNLAKPTKDMKVAMEKYGISLTDSNGEMKSFDKVMLDLRKGLGKLDKDQQAAAASTIFGKEAMSGALAIVNASEEDYKKLTKEIKNSDGAASDMADTMQDNLQGSLKELKSMVEDLFIEMYQNLKPTIESVIDSTKNLTKWFADLSPETQENIVKFGLLAAAMGPVLSITGKLTFGVGGLMKGAGALAKTIGMSKGVGLLGAMGGLGPLAVGGVAVAGLAAVGTVVYKLTKKSKDLEEVNLDVAQSLSDQAVELENSAETFDKLSSKAKISNDELAELDNLNQRISKSSNPGEINELQKQYDALAKKSGLSKDEIKQLFDANKNIIEQSPNVEKSISGQGNEFVKSTDAVHEQIQALRDLSEAQLKGERAKLLEQEAQARKTIAEKTREQAKVEDRMLFLAKNANLSKDELNEKIKEAEENLKGVNRNAEEGYRLDQEHTDLVNIKKERIGETVDELNKQNDELQKSIDKEQENLDKLDATEQQMLNIRLANVGINEEGEKGLAALDKSIEKSDEELIKLDNKLEKNGELTEKEQERYEKLSETNEKHREARGLILEELGVFSDLNALAEDRLNLSNEETQKKVETLAATTDIKVEEGNIIDQIQKKNSEYDKSIEKLEKQKEEEGANKREINKQISEIKDKKLANDEVIKKILQELGVWEDVKDSIESGVKKEKEKGKATDDTKKKLDSQGNAIDANNKKTDAGIGKEKERTKEAGKDADKKVTAKDHGSVARIDKAAMTGKNKRLTVRDHGTVGRIDAAATKERTKKVTAEDYGSISTLNTRASKPVSKTVTLIGKAKGALSRLKFWAKGTPPEGHPGGFAVVGERGKELIQAPSGASFLSPGTDTLMNLPKGTHVIPHNETKRIMKSMPKYADGTNNWRDLFSYDNVKDNEFMKLLALNNKSSKSEAVFAREEDEGTREDKTLKELLNATLEQNRILMQLLRKDNDTILDGESIKKNIDYRLAMELR